MGLYAIQLGPMVSSIPLSQLLYFRAENPKPYINNSTPLSHHYFPFGMCGSFSLAIENCKLLKHLIFEFVEVEEEEFFRNDSQLPRIGVFVNTSTTGGRGFKISFLDLNFIMLPSLS